MVVTTAIAVVLSVGLFILFPAWIGGLFSSNGMGEATANIVEGFLRLAVLVGYIVAISRVSDIRRVFQYHVAEHKVINAYEAPWKPWRQTVLWATAQDTNLGCDMYALTIKAPIND